MHGRLDFPLVEAFLVVADQGTLTRAAHELHCVTSNLGARIKQLEKQLSTTLFVRRRDGMTLTSEGKRLVPMARDLVARRDAIVAQMQASDTAGSLTIATPETFLRTRLIKALAVVHAARPASRIACKVGFSDAVQSFVTQQDAILGVTIRTAAPPSFETLYRWKDRLLLVVPRVFAHRFSKKDLAQLRPLHLGESCFFGRSLMSYLDDRGLAVNLRDRLNSLETIIALVSAGLGFSVLPASFINEHPSRDALALHPVKRRQEFSYFLVAKPQTILSPLAKALLNELKGVDENEADFA